MKLQLGFVFPILLASACSSQVQLGGMGSESKRMVATGGHGEATGAPQAQQEAPQQQKPSAEEAKPAVQQVRKDPGDPLSQQAAPSKEIAGSFLTYEIDCVFTSNGSLSCKVFEVDNGKRAEITKPYYLKIKTNSASGILESNNNSAISTFSGGEIGLDSKCFNASPVKFSEPELRIDDKIFVPKIAFFDQDKYYCKKVTVAKTWMFGSSGTNVEHKLNPYAKAKITEIRFLNSFAGYGNSGMVSQVTFGARDYGDGSCQRPISLGIGQTAKIDQFCQETLSVTRLQVTSQANAGVLANFEYSVEIREKNAEPGAPCPPPPSVSASTFGSSTNPNEKLCVFLN